MPPSLALVRFRRAGPQLPLPLFLLWPIWLAAATLIATAAVLAPHLDWPRVGLVLLQALRDLRGLRIHIHDRSHRQIELTVW